MYFPRQCSVEFGEWGVLSKFSISLLDLLVRKVSSDFTALRELKLPVCDGADEKNKIFKDKNTLINKTIHVFQVYENPIFFCVLERLLVSEGLKLCSRKHRWTSRYHKARDPESRIGLSTNNKTQNCIQLNPSFH